MKKTVLVGVLKSKDDLRILLKEKWYRIPVAFLPKRRFTHIAFYEPACFGARGKRIAYYARVSKMEVKKRIELLPSEPSHPRARDDYLKCSFLKIVKLKHPIRNIIPRRISFGFTDLKTLRSAKDILELYHVTPTEQIMEKALQRDGITVISQYRLSYKGKRYRIDLAVFCNRGNLAIECDNRRAHASKAQKLKDKQKDITLKRLGWRIVRLTEVEIIEHLDSCVFRVQKSIVSLGGILLIFTHLLNTQPIP